MDCALVTAIGSFSADIVIKNLKKMDFRVIGCDIYPKEWIADAYQVNAFYQSPYAVDEEKYIEFVKQICVSENITWILPSTDVEVDVFNRNREWFSERNITICISSAETLQICRDKQITEEFVRKNVPHVHTIPTLFVKQSEFPPAQYPVVCKPTDGRSSQGLKYIHSKEEWEHFVSSTNLDKYIVQPYIEGHIITVDVIRDRFDSCIAIPRRELLRTPNGAGTSVYVYRDQRLEEDCMELARGLKILGCVNFEFIMDNNGKYYLLECNPRFAGGVEFSCIVGYDCVRNHIQAFQGGHIDEFQLKHNHYIARKYEEYVTAVD